MKDLAKVAIGSKFVEPWFERRAEGGYAGFRAPMDADAHVVQRALLVPRRRQPVAGGLLFKLTSTIKGIF